MPSSGDVENKVSFSRQTQQEFIMEHESSALDKWSRWIFLPAFIVLNLFYWVYYLVIDKNNIPTEQWNQRLWKFCTELGWTWFSFFNRSTIDWNGTKYFHSWCTDRKGYAKCLLILLSMRDSFIDIIGSQCVHDGSLVLDFFVHTPWHNKWSKRTKRSRFG